MHIMLALDESRYADTIVEWMVQFPHPLSTRLTLCHVIEPWDGPEALAAKQRLALRRQQEAGARVLLARAARALQKSYPDIRVVIREGLPIYEVLRLIREQHPDLIVSGTRGLQGAKGLVLGSLSQRLLLYAPCSVMLVPLKIRPARQLRAMLATDGSPGAKHAARLLTRFPSMKAVTVVSAVRPTDARERAIRAVAGGPGSPALLARLNRIRQATARGGIQDTLAVLRPSGAALKARLLTGHPVDVIPRAARQDQCDLLVMGSRGLTGKTAMALGSVSLAVAQQAPCPVLVVKKTV